jgi:hypothetical protein
VFTSFVSRARGHSLKSMARHPDCLGGTCPP